MPTIAFIVIKIDTFKSSVLYYFTFIIELIWLRTWLDINSTGAALKRVGKLFNPFCRAY